MSDWDGVLPRSKIDVRMPPGAATPSDGPPQIYDITIDEWRPVIQTDIDQFMALSRAYGEIRRAYKAGADLRVAIEAAHDHLVKA